MEPMPPFRTAVYASVALTALMLLAASFYAIDQVAIYTLYKSETERQLETASVVIFHHRARKGFTGPNPAAALEDLQRPPLVASTPLKLRGLSKVPSQPDNQITQDDLKEITQQLAQTFPHFHITAYDRNKNEIGQSTFPPDSGIHHHELTDSPKSPYYWQQALETGVPQFFSDFSPFKVRAPVFTSIIPYGNMRGENLQVLGGFLFCAKPVISNSSFIRSLSLTSSAGFGVVLLLALVSIGFIWKHMRDRWKTSKTIRFLAHHDPLTRLPNRAVFSDQLKASLRKAHSTASDLFLVSIDVDKFKAVNDTYGHAAGDIFLQVIADRLRMVFGNYLVARLAGDEFAVLIEGVSKREDVSALIKRMQAVAGPPCIINGKRLNISLSMGVAMATDATWKPSRLLHCADLALYKSKAQGRSTATWYNTTMDEDLERRREIEEDLRKALKTSELTVEYQPQVNLRSKRLEGFEALIRWEHPTRGWIEPDEFIPIAEESVLIEELGEYVLQQACYDAALWQDPTLKVSVNFSPAQFKFGKTEKNVTRSLALSGLPPERLEIEITENLLISDTESVIESLNIIREIGVSVAMDDFGTGYSSLSYLSRFPFDKIKIDRSFITNIGQENHADAIILAIVGLGQSLDVIITAEGVENERQAAILKDSGCHQVQGFYFGRPGPVDPLDPAANVRCVKPHTHVTALSA
ncbi:putative bifunctional diguanylate cyclase/phosphodiesterase [Flexibacterium corallicola]|uniref:putative bifunctional diguanylate cyclase/phosphodiesterase n=1 Tax=Flexibacterium corallicola TaxID=3037259 RepID=UPI00286F6260|nr:EAL domain-containing protein [Pseudovibrio sp. M1P-2-3]